MQCIKESSTLRVSSKQRKPSPRIVYLKGEQDRKIADFIKWRRFIKKIIRD